MITHKSVGSKYSPHFNPNRSLDYKSCSVCFEQVATASVEGIAAMLKRKWKQDAERNAGKS